MFRSKTDNSSSKIQHRAISVRVRLTKGSTMVTKLRPWTATEIHRLKGLAKKKLGVSKIARSLKRTTVATVVKAQALGIPVDARG